MLLAVIRIPFTPRTEIKGNTTLKVHSDISCRFICMKLEAIEVSRNPYINAMRIFPFAHNQLICINGNDFLSTNTCKRVNTTPQIVPRILLIANHG